MTLDTGLMMLIGALFIFFLTLSIFGGRKIFNLFAFACLIWLDVAYITSTVGILITVLIMVWLLVDIFWSGKERDL